MHLAGCIVGNCNAVMREIGAAAVRSANGAPVAVDGSGQYADAIAIIVVRLHAVFEPEIPRVCAAMINGPPLLRANF